MSNNSYFCLAQIHPEILCSAPRAGGIANIEMPSYLAGKPLGKKGKSSLPTRSVSIGSLRKNQHRSESKRSLISSNFVVEPEPCDYDQISRHFKINRAVSTTPWSVEFDETASSECSAARFSPPFQDAIDMLAMTISIVMLLSKGYGDISQSYFKWALSYLRCIKDEFGNTLPNIQGILNHILMVTSGKVKSFLDPDDSDDDNDDDDKSGQKRVRMSSMVEEQEEVE